MALKLTFVFLFVAFMACAVSEVAVTSKEWTVLRYREVPVALKPVDIKRGWADRFRSLGKIGRVRITDDDSDPLIFDISVKDEDGHGPAAGTMTLSMQPIFSSRPAASMTARIGTATKLNCHRAESTQKLSEMLSAVHVKSGASSSDAASSPFRDIDESAVPEAAACAILSLVALESRFAGGSSSANKLRDAMLQMLMFLHIERVMDEPQSQLTAAPALPSVSSFPSTKHLKQRAGMSAAAVSPTKVPASFSTLRGVQAHSSDHPQLLPTLGTLRFNPQLQRITGVRKPAAPLRQL